MDGQTEISVWKLLTWEKKTPKKPEINQILSWPRLCHVLFDIPNALPLQFLDEYWGKFNFSAPESFFLGRREHREQDLNKSSIFPFLFGFFVCSCGQKSWRIDLEMFVLIGQGMYFSSGTGIIFNLVFHGCVWESGRWENQDYPGHNPRIFPFLAWSHPHLPFPGILQWFLLEETLKLIFFQLIPIPFLTSLSFPLVLQGSPKKTTKKVDLKG